MRSKLLVWLLDQLGFTNGPKAIPGWVLGLPLSRLGWFLEGYREGDRVHSGSKQAEGKRRMKQIGSVEVPQEAFIAALQVGEIEEPD